MSVILSRKGFDSGNGYMPSPILPDGTLLPLPIPRPHDPFQFQNLHYNGRSYYDMIHELNPNTCIGQHDTCHLDPDLGRGLNERMEGWRGLFGQEQAAAGHLRNHHIGVGDIFLFFGWFKEAENVNGHYRYMVNAPDLHVLFGYLEIGAIYTERTEVPEYARYHPHFTYFDAAAHPNNIMYEAAETFSFEHAVPGWGYLSYNNNTQLTQEGARNRTHWNLPDCFREVEISYHTPNAFRNGYFQATSRGQEFVVGESEAITDWARNIILNNNDQRL